MKAEDARKLRLLTLERRKPDFDKAVEALKPQIIERIKNACANLKTDVHFFFTEPHKESYVIESIRNWLVDDLGYAVEYTESHSGILV